MIKTWQQILLAIVKTSQPLRWLGTALVFFTGYLFASGTLNWSLVIGTIYFMLPYNLLISGPGGDPSDEKESAAGSSTSIWRQRWWQLAALINLPFLAYFFVIGDWPVRLIMSGLIILSLAFNLKPLRLKAVAVADSVVFSIVGCAGPAVFGLVLGRSSNFYLPALIALLSWGIGSYAFGTIRGIKSNRRARVHSTASTLGIRKTVSLCILLYLFTAMLVAIFYPPTGILAGGMLALYALNASFFRKYRSDVHATQFVRGWNNIQWLNVMVGAGLGLILLFNTDPFGLRGSYAQIYGVFLIAIFGIQTLLIIQNLLGFKRPRSGRLQDWPKVSLLVHTYNQADNISSTLLAALGQNYPDVEIIYGDLGSTDNTLKIVKGYQDPRLRIVDISPTKAGWTVNAWASQQLLDRSNGDIVVLISADTILLPSTISTIVALVENQHLDLLSLLPADQNKTLAQQIILSQNHFLLLGAYPAYMVTKHWPKFSPAYGGLMAFSKAKIAKLDGFRTVHNSPLEDFELAASAREHGLKTGFYIGSDVATSQNHAALNLILSQNSRRFYPTLHFSTPLTLAMSIGSFVIFLLPVLVAIGMFANGIYDGLPIILIAIGYSFANRLIVAISTRQSIFSTLLYPLGCSIVIVQMIGSMLSYELFRPRWQNRRQAF
ncbi:glycosyltransferase [Candidatus Saccharibacteria bacterium]|nr:glycosyltransferase [Candidatus Saccharibacteria bacterium]